MATRSLQQELKQSKPFDTPADEALVALMRTATLVRRAIAQRVRELAAERERTQHHDLPR